MKYPIIRKTLCLTLALGLTLSSLSGCGKKEASAPTDRPSADQEAEKPEASDTSDDADVPANSEVTGAAVSPEKCMKSYQAFLADQEPVYLDYLNKEMCYAYTDIESGLKADTPYTFSEFIKSYCTAKSESCDSNAAPMDIRYAYIDCGNDGIPELALLFNDVEIYNAEYQDYWVIKKMDAKLEVVLYDEAGYRGFGELNEYGCYTSGGANGAASSIVEYRAVDAAGKLQFLYGNTSYLSAYAIYLPDNDKYIEVLEDLGIGERIGANQYYFREYEDGEDYTAYQKESMWTYFAMDDLYREIEDDSIFKPGSDWRTFWDSTELPLNTQAEVDKAISAKELSCGVTPEIKSGDLPSWLTLSDSQIESLYSWKPVSTEYVPDTPPWEFYYFGYEAEPTTRISLKQVKAAGNDITDDDKWFDMLGWAQPDRLQFTDDTYHYQLSGLDASGYQWYPYLMDIQDKNTGDTLYTLDFTNYYKPPQISAGDEDFVEESIHWAYALDGILYVSTFHNTYASSAPQNGYITAFDMKNDFKILWRTEPLTCNSDNFVIVDDAIICGYGFTNEDDFVYVLDRETGVRVQQIKVKTGPDWFYVKDGQLYVRTYNTDYVFDIMK